MMDVQNGGKLLLRVHEAAEILSIARSKAYAMVHAGELPSVKLGKSIRVPAASLKQFVEGLEAR
jgi:excisionase family DNA binding protein